MDANVFYEKRFKWKYPKVDHSIWQFTKAGVIDFSEFWYAYFLKLLIILIAINYKFNIGIYLVTMIL